MSARASAALAKHPASAYLWLMPALHESIQQHALPSRTINVDQEYELQYWSRAFGVGREALLEAVRKVGNDARAVSRQLGKG
jgi:Protein of unknown function (DUF3606)